MPEIKSDLTKQKIVVEQKEIAKKNKHLVAFTAKKDFKAYKKGKEYFAHTVLVERLKKIQVA